MTTLSLTHVPPRSRAQVQANQQVSNLKEEEAHPPTRSDSPVPTVSMSASASPARHPQGRVQELESQVSVGECVGAGG